MASAHPEGDVDLRKKWLRYKYIMEKNAPKAVKRLGRPEVEVLRRNLMIEMESEFMYIRGQFSDDTEADIVGRLWNVLIFRPDVALKTEKLCRSDQLYRELAADLLREAIEAAEWPEDLWSSPPQTEVPPVDLKRSGDALAGLATVSCGDLERRKILTQEGAAAVKKRAPFSESRGCELVRQLTRDGWSKLQDFLSENKFLLRVFDTVGQSHWLGPFAVISDLPKLPKYLTKRDIFCESKAKLEEAFTNKQQEWVVLHGPPGAGKTVTAVHMAKETSHTALWISFGQRKAEEIYQSAQEKVKKCFPTITDSSRHMTPEVFLRETLTAEATKDVIFFFDDVSELAHLAPFVHVKTAVITSRTRIQHRDVKKNVPLEVPLSLTEKESVYIMETMLEKKLSSIDGGEHLRSILKLFHFNALSTSVLSSYIKATDQKKWNKRFFMNLKSDLEKKAERKFGTIQLKLKSTGHDYMDEGQGKLLYIYAALQVIIERLGEESEELKEAFYSLIIFPRGTPIISKVFGRINDDEEHLDLLHDRSLLGRSGEDFSIHDLIRDVLEADIEKVPEKKKSYFKDLVERYEEDDSIDKEETGYYYLQFICSCIEADRTDVAMRLLSCADYLITRFFIFRFTNLFRDFDVVLKVKPHEAVALCHNFLMDSSLWNQGFDKTSLLREAVLFERGSQLDSELVSLAQRAAELPLFQAQDQKIEEKLTAYEEIARKSVGMKITKLALSENGFALAIRGNELPFDSLPTIFNSFVGSSNRFASFLILVQQNLTHFLQTRKVLSREDKRVIVDFLSIAVEVGVQFAKKNLKSNELCFITRILDNAVQVSDSGEQQISDSFIRSALSFLLRESDGRQQLDDEALQLIYKTFPVTELLQYALKELHAIQPTSEEPPAAKESSMADLFVNFVMQFMQNPQFSFDMSSTEILLFDQQLSIRKRRPFNEKVLCAAPTKDEGWLLVTRNGCLTIDSDLCVVIDSEWIAGGNVKMAAVDPCGDLAVLWVEKRPLLLFWAAVADAQEIADIPENSNVQAFSVSASFVAVVCTKKEEEKEEVVELIIWSIEEEKIVAKQKLEGQFLSCAFLSNYRIALCGEKNILLDWRSGITIGDQPTKSSEQFDFVKSSPDGSLVSAGRYFKQCSSVFNFLLFFKIFDSNHCRRFSAEDFDLGVLNDFALSNYNIVAHSCESKELVLFRKTKELKRASFPRIHCRYLSKQKYELLIPTWMKGVEDFVCLMLKDGELVFETSRDESEIFRTRVDCRWCRWIDAGVALWKENCLTIVNLRERSVEELFVQENIISVAWSGTRLFVGSDSGAILLRSGSEWQEIARCDCLVRYFVLFEDTVGAVFTNEHFRIISLSGTELFKAEKIDQMSVSPCRKRFAFWSKLENFVSEVSQEGQELRKIQMSCFSVHCLPNGPLCWTSAGDAFLVQGEQQRQLDFPPSVFQVRVTSDSSFALLLTWERLWIIDLKTGKRELLLDREAAGTNFFNSVLLSPCGRHILVSTGEDYRHETLQYIVLNRR